MARRGGKANTRRARQRQAQRGPRPMPGAAPRPAMPAPPAPKVVESAESAEEPAAPVSSGDAFEKADEEVRAATRAQSQGARPRRGPTPRFATAGGPSRLTERAAAEYHYVTRDLRNIGVLVLVMAVLLAVATIAVNVLGIGPS